MRLRLTKIDELQFLTCFEKKLWGSKLNRFGSWEVGDYLVFIIDKNIAGLAEISGKPFFSEKKVWDGDIYSHRVPIKFNRVFLKENRLSVLDNIKDVLVEKWGSRYGWGIFTQKLLEDAGVQKIVKTILSQADNTAIIRGGFNRHLANAKSLRISASKTS